MVELWHEWNSGHSFKVRVVLAEKRVEWVDRRVELLKFEHLQPGYLKLNPKGVVPTLVHDGRVITESSFICEYLDKRFDGPRLMPAGVADRERARDWLRYYDETVHPAIRAASFELLYRPVLSTVPKADLEAAMHNHPDPARAKAFIAAAADKKTDLDALKRATAQFVSVTERIGMSLAGRAWLSGGEFGLADVALSPFVDRLEQLHMSDLWGRAPATLEWRRRILGRPSVMRARGPVDPGG